MPTFLQDFLYSLRQLIKHPRFAVTAILSLALGIGATVSVFSVIYGVLMHPFPYANVDRLANLSVSEPRGDISDVWFSGSQLRELMCVLATIRDNVRRSDIVGHTINPGAKRAV